MSNFDAFIAIKDVFLFARKLLLKKFHEGKNHSNTLFSTETELEALRALEELLLEQQEQTPSKFPDFIRKKSTNFPPISLNSSVEIFVRMVCNELYQLKTHRPFDNLTAAQRQALNELKNMKQVVFKPADKGGNVVVWPVQLYEREAFKQLNDAECYRKLASDPTAAFQRQLFCILDDALERGLITKSIWEGLRINHPVIPTIYFLPKVHKDLSNPPARPIVSGCGGLNEPICRFLDYYLKPCVEELPSYVRDSADVLQRLQGVTLEPDMFLITGDVEPLYTCINHEQGFSASRFFLSNKGIDGELLDLLLELLEHALTHNYFTFKDKYYVQQRGVAMGAAFAPSYANLFMGQWEREHMLPYLNDVQSPSVVSWMRFINDLLFIWQGERKELDKFLLHLNDNDWNVKLTFKVTTNKMDFLDLQLTVDQTGCIHSTIFRKETSTNSVLHAKSGHPRHTIRAIPKGQFIRAKRICDTDEEFETQARDMTGRFLDRGYKFEDINCGYQQAKKLDRNALLQNKVTKKEDSRLRIITNYHGRWTDMNSIFNQFWPF
ncbi:unnamed protein product [Ranitomeya imitator]|uniref:Reverse transcriptase domain-containing protein n=1 Tax=Ranitomeya imitator TaxID=111125 RepID=A0ABN9M418_9NEOB|nr:unnamed protein product [Ranitomeya imitator]